MTLYLVFCRSWFISATFGICGQWTDKYVVPRFPFRHLRPCPTNVITKTFWMTCQEGYIVFTDKKVRVLGREEREPRKPPWKLYNPSERTHKSAGYSTERSKGIIDLHRRKNVLPCVCQRVVVGRKRSTSVRVWKGCVYPRAPPQAPRPREHVTIPNPFWDIRFCWNEADNSITPRPIQLCTPAAPLRRNHDKDKCPLSTSISSILKDRSKRCREGSVLAVDAVVLLVSY